MKKLPFPYYWQKLNLNKIAYSNRSGVSLISLVVTIIAMIILATIVYWNSGNILDTTS